MNNPIRLALSALFALTMLPACGGAEQEELDEACDRVTESVRTILDECGYELVDGALLECSAATDSDVGDLIDCADEIDGASCEDIESGDGVPTCDDLEDRGLLKAS